MTDDHDASKAPPTKLTTTKQKWARDGKFLTGHSARPDSERLPPGQHLVKDWPVLDLGEQPKIDKRFWRLDVVGDVANPVSWDWAAFAAQPQSKLVTDIHCVTTWSRYDNAWEGLLTRDLLDIVMPAEDAAFVLLQSYDGYTTNLPLEDFAVPDAMLVHSWQGAAAWPSSTVARCAWSCRIFTSGRARSGSSRSNSRRRITPASGRDRGYHMRGDPWREERYSE